MLAVLTIINKVLAVEDSNDKPTHHDAVKRLDDSDLGIDEVDAPTSVKDARLLLDFKEVIVEIGYFSDDDSKLFENINCDIFDSKVDGTVLLSTRRYHCYFPQKQDNILIIKYFYNGANPETICCVRKALSDALKSDGYTIKEIALPTAPPSAKSSTVAAEINVESKVWIY